MFFNIFLFLGGLYEITLIIFTITFHRKKWLLLYLITRINIILLLWGIHPGNLSKLLMSRDNQQDKYYEQKQASNTLGGVWGIDWCNITIVGPHGRCFLYNSNTWFLSFLGRGYCRPDSSHFKSKNHQKHPTVNRPGCHRLASQFFNLSSTVMKCH